MSPTVLVVYVIAAILIGVAGFVVINTARAKGSVARALNMVLLRVSLPRESTTENGQNQRPEKEVISVMEQLFSSLTSIHAKGWNKFVFGEPYIALELAVHHIGEEIHFYIAVPRNYADMFEKQIHGLFAAAEVEPVRDYNIFNPAGVAGAGYFSVTENQILPFKTYARLESDPLGGIVTALSKLQKEGEGAAIQILVRPSHRGEIRKLAQKVAHEMQTGYDFKTAFSRAKHPPKKPKDPSKQKPESPRAVTPFEDEIIKALQSKASKPLFDVNMRIVVSAEKEDRAGQILDDVGSSFTQFNAPALNNLKLVKVRGGALKNFVFEYAFRMFRNSRSFVLSSEELTSLYHFPTTSGLMPRVKYVEAKTSEPPPNISMDGVLIGRNTFRGRTTEIKLAPEDRRRHMYIIGQTGTGKTVTMKAMVRQDIEAGRGVCVIDPHGDFAEYTLAIVPPERADDVIYFDPGDIERPVGLNMMEIDPKHPEQKSMLINELFGIFDKLYDLKNTGGPMFEKYFRNSALLLLDDYENEIPVLADISRVLIDPAFRADKLSREKNPLVREFWELEAQKATGESSLTNMAPYISSKINSFVFDEFLRPIINQRISAFNFRDVMDNKKILILNVSKGRIGELNANLLGMIIVGKLLMAALSRADTDEQKRNDFYLYIDEFQNFTTPSIASILSEARKYRLCMTLANQFIKQLKEEIRDAVFGNAGSIVSFRISPDDAEFMKNKFAPVFSPTDLMKVQNLNAYVNLLIHGMPSRSFNMKVPTEMVFGAGSLDVAAKLREISRLKFGRPRTEVEEELQAR